MAYEDRASSTLKHQKKKDPAVKDDVRGMSSRQKKHSAVSSSSSSSSSSKAPTAPWTDKDIRRQLLMAPLSDLPCDGGYPFMWSDVKFLLHTLEHTGRAYEFLRVKSRLESDPRQHVVLLSCPEAPLSWVQTAWRVVARKVRSWSFSFSVVITQLTPVDPKSTYQQQYQVATLIAAADLAIVAAVMYYEQSLADVDGGYATLARRALRYTPPGEFADRQRFDLTALDLTEPRVKAFDVLCRLGEILLPEKKQLRALRVQLDPPLHFPFPRHPFEYDEVDGKYVASVLARADASMLHQGNPAFLAGVIGSIFPDLLESPSVEYFPEWWPRAKELFVV
jgi:hypothetical protein